MVTFSDMAGGDVSCNLVNLPGDCQGTPIQYSVKWKYFYMSLLMGIMDIELQIYFSDILSIYRAHQLTLNRCCGEKSARFISCIMLGLLLLEVLLFPGSLCPGWVAIHQTRVSTQRRSPERRSSTRDLSWNILHRIKNILSSHYNGWLEADWILRGTNRNHFVVTISIYYD